MSTDSLAAQVSGTMSRFVASETAPSRPSDSAGPRFPALRVLSSAALLLLVFLASGVVGYRAYLAGPRVSLAEPLPSQHAPVAARAVLFVIDAFTPGRAFDPSVMPTVARLAKEGASGIAQTGLVTMTAPGIYSLMTGRPGTFVQALFNFDSSETRVDSLASLMAATGRRIVLAGDPAWHKQFGWLARDEDRHQEQEQGITADHEIDGADVRSVDFLVDRLREPSVGMAVVHVGSVDAVGHAVTPHVERYFEQLTFIDTQLEKVVGSIDLRTTVLLVCGDHGMAARGTHGGEEEARLTPYVLAGPGIKPGVVADLPQTALTATLAALLGLPFLPVSEQPPMTELLGLPGDRAQALEGEYFQGKLRAARAVSGTSTLGSATTNDPDNAHLNELLFGAEDSRAKLRAAAAGLATLGILFGALLAWRSTPARFARPSVLGYLGSTVAVPLAIATVATVFMWLRGYFAFQSVTIALWIMVALIASSAGLAFLLYRSPTLLTSLGRWQLSLYLPVMLVLSGPLLNSHWLDARPYFEALILFVALGASAFHRTELKSRVRSVALPPLVTAAFLVAPNLSLVRWHDGLFLPALSLTVLGLALHRLRRARSTPATLGRLLLVGLFAAAWAWRFHGGTTIAAAVLVSFLLVVLCAGLLEDDVGGAAALLIGGAAGLFLIMAAESHEAIVFLAAALVALALSKIRLNLAQQGLLYVVAAVVVLLRVCLFYELGDQYNLSSIRTAPGFLLADYGLSLGTVIALLLLKYSLPWLLIFGAVLRSLSTAGRAITAHVLDLLVLGYVARFAAVAAVIDPLRTLPNGMNGIVGTFCVTWAEFITFAMAAAVAVVLVRGESGVVKVASGGLPNVVSASRTW